MTLTRYTIDNTDYQAYASLVGSECRNLVVDVERRTAWGCTIRCYKANISRGCYSTLGCAELGGGKGRCFSNHRVAPFRLAARAVC